MTLNETVSGSSIGPDAEMQLSLPRDIRLLQAIRSLAVQATRHVGCSDDRAEAFVRAVEELARTHLEDTGAAGDVSVVVRMNAHPLQFSVASRTITLDI